MTNADGLKTFQAAEQAMHDCVSLHQQSQVSDVLKFRPKLYSWSCSMHPGCFNTPNGQTNLERHTRRRPRRVAVPAPFFFIAAAILSKTAWPFAIWASGAEELPASPKENPVTTIVGPPKTNVYLATIYIYIHSGNMW